MFSFTVFVGVDSPARLVGFAVMCSAVEKIIHRFPQLINDKKDDGFTSLHLAALNDHQDVARVLLRDGQCEVDPKNNRRQSPLLLAVSQGHTKLIELLVGHGADVNAEDEDGDTCLHLALMRQSMSSDGVVELPLMEQVQSPLSVHLSAICLLSAYRSMSAMSCNDIGTEDVLWKD